MLVLRACICICVRACLLSAVGSFPTNIPNPVTLIIEVLKRPHNDTELTQYERIGEALRESSESTYKSMNDFFENSSTDGPLPFVAIVESSGCGKTQLAFSAPAGTRVLYVPMIKEFYCAQRIYGAFECIASLIFSCIDSDLDSLRIKDAIPTTEQLHRLLQNPGRLYLLGLLSVLYTHLGQTPSSVFSENKVTVVPMTHAEFLDHQRGRSWANVLIFLDEAMVEERSVCFLRNFLQVLHIRAVLMGTSTSLANFDGKREGHQMHVCVCVCVCVCMYSLCVSSTLPYQHIIVYMCILQQI